MTLFLVCFALLIILNAPIVFCLFIPSVLYLLQNSIPLAVASQRVIAGVDSFPLLAVPLFVLAGNIMNGAGITERIFGVCDKLLGHFRGGLGYANIVASVIFAGMSGSAIADAGGLGAVELKAMRNAGYDDDFSLAVTGASSIIGPIIPPSVPAVVFAVVTEVSVGRLFIGGIIPGLLMAGIMSVIVYMQCKKRGYTKKKRATVRELFIAIQEAFLPLLTPVIILTGIFSGIFTPTETASVTVAYALIVGFIYKSITLKNLSQLFIGAAKTTASVIVIVSSAALFGWVLARDQIPQTLSYAFVGVISSRVTALIILNIFLLIIGTFMDNSAAIPILAPVLLPLAVSYGIDPIHFGLIMILNLMIGLLTPPVGLVLYVLASVSNVPFEKIARMLIPHIIALIIVLYVITFVPQIVLFLPNQVFGS
jgi:tripartite ATP-independent transporter DctM subunit